MVKKNAHWGVSKKMTTVEAPRNDEEILKFWINRWGSDETKWHEPQVNVHLQKYFERLRSVKGEGEEFKVFVPLCGKSLDVKWLLDKGCSVVGVEGSEKGIQELFKQHNLSYKTTPLQNKDFLYQCEGFPLKVYNCNIFDFPDYNKEKFDLVWDRGSFVSINYEQREDYASLMKGLYAPKFNHLLESLFYESTYDKAPRKLPLSVVQELLGDEFNYEHLETVDELSKSKAKFGADFKFMNLLIFLISPK